MIHHALCQGLDLHCCLDCARNVDNHPGVKIMHMITPAAAPPRCADWKALPIVPLPAKVA